MNRFLAGPHQGKMLLANGSGRQLWKPWVQTYPDTRIMKVKNPGQVLGDLTYSPVCVCGPSVIS